MFPEDKNWSNMYNSLKNVVQYVKWIAEKKLYQNVMYNIILHFHKLLSGTSTLLTEANDSSGYYVVI